MSTVRLADGQRLLNASNIYHLREVFGYEESKQRCDDSVTELMIAAMEMVRFLVLWKRLRPIFSLFEHFAHRATPIIERKSFYWPLVAMSPLAMAKKNGDREQGTRKWLLADRFHQIWAKHRPRAIFPSLFPVPWRREVATPKPMHTRHSRASAPHRQHANRFVSTKIHQNVPMS